MHRTGVSDLRGGTGPGRAGHGVFEAGALVVDGRIGRRRLSPSVAKAMEGCPARWAVEQLLPRTADPFGAAEEGTSAHWVLEQLFGLAGPDRTPEAARSFLAAAASGAGGADIILPPAADLDRWRQEVWQLVAPALTAEDPGGVDVVGRELKLGWDGRAEVAGVPFRGTIDRLDRLPDGSLRVVDYKTARKGMPTRRFGDRDPHGDQLRMYALALSRLGEHVGRASIVYTATGQVYDASTAPSEMDRVAGDFAQAWTTLNGCTDSGVWPTAPSPLCGWCNACSICPAAAAAGRGEPRVPAGFAAAASSVIRVGAPHTVRVSRTDEEHTMNINRIFCDAKRWEEQGPDGRLNGDSPAAMAAFGFAAKATDLLAGARMPLTRTTVTAMARTLAHIVDAVQADVYGSAGLMPGINTRLRGALWTAIEQFPVPFGEPEPAWDAWVKHVTIRTRSIALVAFEVWSTGPGERPWADLATPSELSAPAELSAIAG